MTPPPTPNGVQFILREGVLHVVVVPPVEHLPRFLSHRYPLLFRERAVDEGGEGDGPRDVTPRQPPSPAPRGAISVGEEEEDLG